MQTKLFSILSFNIHKGLSPLNRRVIVHDLRARLHALSPDIVMLQEVQDAHSSNAARHADWPLLAQSRFLAAELWPEVHYGRNSVYDHGHHGNLILSRFPVDSVRNDDISDHRFEQRGLLHVPVVVAGHTVHAIVVHFGLVHRSRMRQVQRLAQFIRTEIEPGAPLIVAGDFNDWGERLDGPMHELGLSRAMAPGRRRSECVTFPSVAPVFALDRFYLRGLACRSTLVPRGVAWARMSDHLPLVAELELA
jgi:endonuclease/exonuclease/phosphatase family metal-dependent hydrolase